MKAFFFNYVNHVIELFKLNQFFIGLYLVCLIIIMCSFVYKLFTKEYKFPWVGFLSTIVYLCGLYFIPEVNFENTDIVHEKGHIIMLFSLILTVSLATIGQTKPVKHKSWAELMK